ncbi:hypothetical protein OS493_014524 [Desmophyllum pertusum]|uniref:P/Homo B domain-containing protein n=1 Tax=Desmophyllum pertusum TaxID=174260 RepID=A0A9W9YST6_9CNID|nr:hypothetical protein OS493_014524 [Desmophyllum pertusum]
MKGRENLTNWVITTLFHWGESPIGTWQLDIEDFGEQYPSTGTLYSWSLILYGTTSDPLNYNGHVPIIATAVTQKPSLTHPTSTRKVPTTKKPTRRTEEDQQKENTESETRRPRESERREHEQRQTERGEDIVKPECTSVVVYVSSFKESPKTDTNVAVCFVKESTDGRGVMV